MSKSSQPALWWGSRALLLSFLVSGLAKGVFAQ